MIGTGLSPLPEEVREGALVEKPALPHEDGARVPSLDLVRGMAILLVLLAHVRWMSAGWVGVDLFFVLSGFLITGILLDTVGRPGYFRNFYARRVLRIFPLYFLCVLIFARGKDLLWMSGFLANYRHAPILEHFWSMGIEEQFYLGWPLLVWVFRKRIWMVSLVLVGVALVVRYVGNVDPYMDTFARMDEPAWGGLLCVVLRARPGVAKWGVWVMVVMVMAMTGLQVEGPPRSWHVDPYPFVALAAMGALAGAVYWKPRSGVLEWLGKYSYGIYVYHVILMWYLGNWGIVMSLGVAYVSYHVFEAPILGLKKWFRASPRAGLSSSGGSD